MAAGGAGYINQRQQAIAAKVNASQEADSTALTANFIALQNVSISLETNGEPFSFSSIISQAASNTEPQKHPSLEMLDKAEEQSDPTHAEKHNQNRRRVYQYPNSENISLANSLEASATSLDKIIIAAQSIKIEEHYAEKTTTREMSFSPESKLRRLRKQRAELVRIREEAKAAKNEAVLQKSNLDEIIQRHQALCKAEWKKIGLWGFLTDREKRHDYLCICKQYKRAIKAAKTEKKVVEKTIKSTRKTGNEANRRLNELEVKIVKMQRKDDAKKQPRARSWLYRLLFG